MKTDPDLAFSFCSKLFDALYAKLSDPVIVQERITEIESHARAFPEVLFCKGCVLPIVDLVATQFLSEKLQLTHEKIRASLRCEGFTSLPEIYSPGIDQSGFSSSTWGKNYQPKSKQGAVTAPEELRNKPCPDFGIVHEGQPPFTLLGESKFSRNQKSISINKIKRDLRYYMSLPKEPEKGWIYDFGFGVSYAAAGSRIRKADFITEYWRDHRFVIAHFTESE